MQRQDKPDGNEPRRPVTAAMVKGKGKVEIQMLPPRDAVQRGRRRVRTRMTPRRYRPDPMPTQFSSSDESFGSSDEDSFIPSGGSLDSISSMEPLDILNECSDFTYATESNSPTALEGEASEDRIPVTNPPVKNSADLEEPEESDDTPAELTDENEKPTEKTPEEIADKKATLEQELQDGSEGSEKKNKDLMSTDKEADKEAVLKKEQDAGCEKKKKDLKSTDKEADKEAVLKKEQDAGCEKKKKDLNQGKSASKETAEVQPKPAPAEVLGAGPAQDPAAKPGPAEVFDAGPAQKPAAKPGSAEVFDAGPAQKPTAKPDPGEVFDAGPAQEPAAKRRKESE